MTRAACVLLPGMLCTAALWSGQEAALRSAAQVVHVPLRAPSIEEMAADVIALPHERMVLIGLSLGGIVAMAAARLAPHRVAGLALMSTNARGPRPDQLAAWARLEKRVEAGEFALITPQALLPTLLHSSRQSDRRLTGAVVAMADQIGPDVFVRQLAAQRSRTDERPGLADLRCPVLVVAAGADALCPLARHEEIAALIPGARLEILDGAGHLSPLERPRQVARLLRRWLEGRAPGQPENRSVR